MANVQDMDQLDFFDDDNVVADVETTEISTVEEVSKSEELATTSKLGGIGIDFSVLASTLPGVAVGNTGITVSRFPVERIKFSKGQKSMISILSDQVIVAKTHYDEDLGNFLCFGGECCEHDLARVRYVYPIIRYTVDAKGKPMINRDENNKVVSPAFEVQNMCLVIGQDTYQSLMDTQDLKGSLTNFDFLINCTDDQYQKITIQEAGEARYKKDPKLVDSIQKFWKENSKSILKSVARKITPDEYKTLKSGEMTASDDVDFDDVFGDE